MDIDEPLSNESDGETGEPLTILFASHLVCKWTNVFLNIYRTWHESW
jgi:hypothetical protein